MRVKEILKEKGMTAKELSTKLGMSEVGLNIALSDKGNPPLKRLYEIATALEVDITELFDRPQVNSFNCPKCGTPLKISIETEK